MKKIISLLVIASFLIGGASALAQTTTQETIKVGIEPDSVFYFLENWKEQIQLFFTFNLEKKAEQYQKLAEERLAEYQRMLDKGKNEIAAKVLAKYEDQLGRALENAKKFQAKQKDSVKDKIKEISDNVAKHIEVLQNNLLNAKESAKEGLQNAIEAAQKVIEKFNNPEEGDNEIIGGDKDEHDCLGSAGYSWCVAKGKCLRVFEEWCADQARELVVNDLKEESGVKFQYQGESSFTWMIWKDNQVVSLPMSGAYYKAENVSMEESNKIEKYLNDNLEMDKYNVADGIIGGLRGYISGYMACVMNFSFPNVIKTEGAPSVPQTDIRTIEIKCGFFNSNLANATNNFDKTGNLSKQNGEWVLIYEEPGKPALIASLSFNEKSICEKGAQKDVCVLNNLNIGERTRIIGTLEGGVLTVYDLIWLGNE
jgi:gas vesicle protein